MAFYLAVFDLAVLWSELCNEATFQQAGTGQDANMARDSHMPCTTHRQNPESYDDTERFLFWQISDLTQFLNANSLSNPRNGWHYKMHRAFFTKRVLSCQSIHMLPWTETILVHQLKYNISWIITTEMKGNCQPSSSYTVFLHGVLSPTFT